MVTLTRRGLPWMEEHVSKSRFKARALEYFRKVQQTGRPIVITERGKPVLRLVPIKAEADEALRVLRGSVIAYRDPTEPVGIEDWEALR